MGEKYGAQLMALRRFVRAAASQMPTIIATVGQVAGFWQLPAWVLPLLVFLGAVLQALDKLVRELNKETV